MAIPYFIRPYRLDDEKKIVELLNIVFSGWPHFDLSCSPIAHWKWKFLDSSSSLPNIFVAEYNSKIIGTEGRIFSKVKVGDTILNCEHRVDLAVHPDFRRMGIFTKIHESLNDKSRELDVQFSYSCEGNPIVIDHMKKIGVQTFSRNVINFIWIKNTKLFLEKYKKRPMFLLNIGLKIYAKINKVIHASLKKEDIESWNIIEIDRFDDRFEDFWIKVSKEYDYIIVRNKNYLNWRYADPRGGSYIIKMAIESGNLIGYIVLRVNKYNESGSIVDLMALQGREGVAESLIKNTLKFFIDANVNEVNCWMIADHPYVKLLNRLGFLNLNRNTLIDFLPYNIDENTFKNIIEPNKKIYVSIGDCDRI